MWIVNSLEQILLTLAEVDKSGGGVPSQSLDWWHRSANWQIGTGGVVILVQSGFPYMYFATPLKMLNFTRIRKNQITSNFVFSNFLIIEHLQKY